MPFDISKHVGDSEVLPEPAAKRQKLGAPGEQDTEHTSTVELMEGIEHDPHAQKSFNQSNGSSAENLLPPSRVLLGDPPASYVKETASSGHTLEFDVGISEYISKDLPPMHAIIKQR